MTAETESTLPELQQAERIYRLLSRVFLDEPDACFLREIASGEMGGVLRALGFDALADILRLPIEAQVAELECEYTRLFIGPGPHIAPYESVLRGEGRHWGDHTVAVNKFYRASGFAVRDETTEMPDHVGIEFEFIAHLLKREREAQTDRDRKNIAGAARARKDFMAAHVLTWLPELNAQIGRCAKFAFYREFSRFALEWVRQDAAEIKDLG